MPAKFRHQLGDRVYLARRTIPWPCTPKTAFEELATGCSTRFDRGARSDDRRWLRIETVEVEIDSAGRITIPARLREFANLTDDVIVNGAFDLHRDLGQTRIRRDAQRADCSGAGAVQSRGHDQLDPAGADPAEGRLAQNERTSKARSLTVSRLADGRPLLRPLAISSIGGEIPTCARWPGDCQ